ncbi:MAG: LysE family transporter [Acidobacteria bacterium]|nr:LysE family transporter [Acidobacteriota bacterium]
MYEINLLIRGMIAGLIIAVPVGPVNVFCIHRTIEKGWKAGVIAGFGAAAADTLYGAVAGFSISFVIELLLRETFWFRLFGGILLIGIGVSYLLRSPHPVGPGKDGADHSDMTSAFLLNLTNPTTVLSFLAVLAALRMDAHRPWWQTVFLVAGIFLGSMAWWIVLSAVVNHFREKIDNRMMLWMNRAAGLAIGGFGIVTLIFIREGF